MLVYLNRGLILEQAVCAAVEDYLHTRNIDKIFRNFHTHVTLQHPFAHLFLDKGGKTADHFPAVVISTDDDGKPPELDGLPPAAQGTELDAVGLSSDDIDAILDTNETVVVGGHEKMRSVPGVPIVADEESVKAVRDALKTRERVYGYAARTYRQDSISIEIWAENAQVRNQIYEDLRLFVVSNLRNILTSRYGNYDIKIDEESIRGQRSSAYNIDFAVVLFGANICFEANYAIEQIVIDTAWEQLRREIILEETNYAKN
jgi:hypothetical protein